MSEGYSSSQLAFESGSNTLPFEPLVETYWNTYSDYTWKNLVNRVSNPTISMNIWFNNFPLKLKNSTLTTGVSSASNYSSVEWNSMLLKRNTLNGFDTGWS